MSRPEDELAALAADLRAVLDAAALSHQPVPVTPAAPGANPPRPVVGTTATSPGASARSSAWSTLATAARADAEADLVHGAAGLQRVRDDLGDCRRCTLCSNRRNLVFGVGDPESDLVIVGEAPGFHEDRLGEPFVGPAGQMLDKMLEHVLGLRRDQVYICNVIKCRPPENRNPLPDEVDACLPFLERQIAAIAPKVLLVLGTVAFKTLFRTEQGITRHRGIWKDLGGIPAMPTFHPAYLLRQPQDKRMTFEDLKAVRTRYDAEGGRR